VGGGMETVEDAHLAPFVDQQIDQV
jgi:hypothetical protein